MLKKLGMILVALAIINSVWAQSQGKLQVTTTTSSAGGNFAPKNIVAIWVENENGKFVKTLAAFAQTRKTYLTTWKKSTTDAGSVYNVVDAVTGATRTSHGTLTCAWDGSDYQGNQVSDGTYNIKFELTDKDATGNLAAFTFKKSSASQEQTPDDVPSFKSTSLKWESLSTNGLEKSLKSNELEIRFDPSSHQLSVAGVTVKKLEIFNMEGKLVLTGKTSQLNMNNLSDGIYVVVINSDRNNFSRKVLKR